MNENIAIVHFRELPCISPTSPPRNNHQSTPTNKKHNLKGKNQFNAIYLLLIIYSSYKKVLLIRFWQDFLPSSLY